MFNDPLKPFYSFFKLVNDLNKLNQLFALPKEVVNHEKILQAINFQYTFAEQLLKTNELFQNNPEIAFLSISELELLNLQSSEFFLNSLNTTPESDEHVKNHEHLLNKNLLPYLERLKIAHIWEGASDVLLSNSNPDRLRHALVSLRTLLEFFIDHELAPNHILESMPNFSEEFKGFHRGKQKLADVKISRSKRIEYIASKIELGIMEQLTKDDINFICGCYTTLCQIHNPDVGLTENQVKILKIKTGITLWLLAYINEIIKSNATETI